MIPTPTPSKPALNTADHYAYIMGYPDGTVQPGGYITRAEASTIFFRLLTDKTREQYWATTNAYSDIKSGDWYNNAISTLSNAGIVSGYPDGTFRPNAAITRAEFAAIAARFDETQSGKSATFSDVIGHWAAKEIGIDYANEWIKGYPDGTFKPDNQVTYGAALKLIMLAAGYDEQKPVNSNVFSGYLARAQADGLVSGSVNLNAPITRLAVSQIAAKAMGLSISNLSSVRPFTDTTEPYVQALNAAGIVEGYFSNGTSTFKPYNTLTRGQISAIVWRMEQAQ